MRFFGRIGATIVVGAAVWLRVFDARLRAQVRTFGPAAPYLVTGRSVSVPPYHQVGPAVDRRVWPERPDAPGTMIRAAPEPAGGDQSAPKYRSASRRAGTL